MDDPGGGIQVLYALLSTRVGDKGPCGTVRVRFVASNNGDGCMAEVVEDSAGVLT